MNREELVRDLSRWLGDRQLVWFGTRGDDAESAADLKQFAANYSFSGAYTRRFSVESNAFEEITGVRVDLDEFDIDEHPRDPASEEFRQRLLKTLRVPSVVFTYRPSLFLSAACFARSDRVQYAGLFHGHQSAFEHKPWVESEVRELGVPCIPWRYISDSEQLRTISDFDSEALVLRVSRSSGGTGLVRVDDPTEVAARWPHNEEAYVAVAPFLEADYSINVGAVVWDSGVTLHPASVQLIGVPELTNREFGYCGNDFAAMEDVEPAVLEQIEDATVRLARWLRTHGYLGAFGADFLVHDGVALFTEVNPRLQGSTHLSCRISVERGESCILLEHLASCLGMEAPSRSAHLSDYVADTQMSHMVVHHTGDTPAQIDPSSFTAALLELPSAVHADVLTAPELRTLPGGTILRLTLRRRVTDSGRQVDPEVAGRIRQELW